MDQHTWHTFIDSLMVLGGAGTSFLLYNLLYGTFHRLGAKRLVAKLNRRLDADQNGILHLDKALRGRLLLVYPKYRWLSFSAVKIVLELVPRNPKRTFATRVLETIELHEPVNLLPSISDPYKKLEKNYQPTQFRHTFWALMSAVNRRFIMKHRVEIGAHRSTWLLTKAHPFFSISLLLLPRKLEKKLPIWTKIVRQALDANPLLPLAELLAHEPDERIRRQALFYWMIAKPYHPKLHQRLEPPTFNAYAESIMLWLYCGGTSKKAMWESLMARDNSDHVALLTSLLERLPHQQKIQQNLKALEFKHLARNASCVLMQMQDPLVVPHFIARYCENRGRLELLTGLCLPEDARAKSFLREVLEQGALEERIQAAYELAKCGNQADLITMASIKNNADYRLRKRLEAPILRLRTRLGVDGATAGLLTPAEVPDEVGALSTAEPADLALAASPQEALISDRQY